MQTRLSTQYRIVTATDGVHWLSLEPFYNDLLRLRDSMKESAQPQIQPVIAMIASLLQEAQLQDLQAQVPDGGDIPYSEYVQQC